MATKEVVLTIIDVVVRSQDNEFNLTRIYRLCNVHKKDRTKEKKITQVVESLENRSIIVSTRQHSGETWYRVPEPEKLFNLIE